jgi:hypothetical protein
MSAAPARYTRRNPIVVGAVLIAIGAIAWGMMAADFDPTRWLGQSGWTLFIFIPGLILFVGGLLAEEGPALPLTIAGTIVMTIAALLFGMDRTEHYEAWAYAWTLIPAAAGFGVLVHAVRTGDRVKIGTALRVITISLVMLVVGGWFFETIFQTGTVPFGLEAFWPLMLVTIGVIVIAGAFLRPPGPMAHPKP